MKKSTTFAAAILLFAFLLTPGAFAQGGPGFRWHGSGGWGMGTPYQRMYDPSKMVTVKGTVAELTTVAPMKGMYQAVALMVKTDTETLEVHLGPEWYVGRLDTQIRKGDSVEVMGSKASYSGKTWIVAAEVKRGKDVLVLRNKAGVPVWSGWRRW